jgi:predicted transcriptional regulator
MRTSDFWRLMDDEFGSAYSRTLAQTLHLSGLGDRTPAQALQAGTDPKAVWLAVCEMQDVPEYRWLGRDVKPR